MQIQQRRVRYAFAGLLAAVLMAVQVGGEARAAQDWAPPALIEGFWQIAAYSPQLKPADGAAIPFTPAGMARYRETQGKLRQNPASDLARSTCVPEGVPRSLTSPYPFDIVPTPGQILFLHETNRAVRMVLMQAAHNDPGDWDPSYMGDSIGRREGEVLVIDTNNFNDATWLDDSGLPHSDALHTVERLRILPGGQRLEDLITIEDPAMFSKPWTLRLVFERRPNLIFSADWVCGEPHRDIRSLPGAGSYR
jgi:hypothetical protein